MAKITLTVDDELKIGLKYIAKKCECSVNELIVSIIYDGMDLQKKLREQRRAETDRYFATSGRIKKANGTTIDIE